MKKTIIGALIFIMIIIIIVLSVLLVHYKNLYEEASKPVFGYYINKDLQITNLDLINHNSLYEYFFIGEYNYEETVRRIKILQATHGTSIVDVNIILNDVEYSSNKLDNFKTIINIIEETKGNYFINVSYDETGSIGKRYRRNDEIGTPYCVTFDFDSLNDQCVTVRERDSMQQVRMKISDLKDYLMEHTFYK